jgi:excinuclease ABC subunit A
MVVIEHNLDIVKVADYIIDVGKEGGMKGGEIICEGTPEKIVKDFAEKSYTAHYLKMELKNS